MKRINLNNTMPIERQQNSQRLAASGFSYQYGYLPPSQGYSRNKHLEAIRVIYNASRDLQTIVKQMRVNAIGAALKPNIIYLQQKLGLNANESDYISKLWENDAASMVCAPQSGLYNLQHTIAKEIALAGEIFLYVSMVNGSLKLTPIHSEFIDSTLYVEKTQAGTSIISGVELDPLTNQPAAFWYKKPGGTEEEYKRIDASSVIWIAHEDSYYMRGIPHLNNPDYLQRSWGATYNMVEKAKITLSVTGWLKTHSPETKVNKRGGNVYGDMRQNAAGALAAGEQKNPTGMPSIEIQQQKLSAFVGNYMSYHFNETANFGVLYSADELIFPQADIITSGTLDALKYSVAGIATGLGVTKEQVTGDLSETNFTAARFGLQISHRFTKTFFTENIENLMEDVWGWWVESHKDNPIISKLWRGFYAVSPLWIKPKPIDIDPLKTANAESVRMQSGTLTTQQVLIEEGLDPQAHRAIWIADNNIYGYKETKVQKEDQKEVIIDESSTTVY